MGFSVPVFTDGQTRCNCLDREVFTFSVHGVPEVFTVHALNMWNKYGLNVDLVWTQYRMK